MSSKAIFFTKNASKQYLIQDTIRTIRWNETGLRKKIAEFNCIEAKGDFSGRTYTVWYTPEIAVPLGPWKLQGLPGLILEARDDEGAVYFSFTGLKLSGKPAISLTINDYVGKGISKTEFNEIYSKEQDKFKRLIESSPKEPGVKVEVITKRRPPHLTIEREE